MNKIISVLSLLSFCLFSWEYVAVRRKLETSPSFVLNKVAKNFQWGWEKLGCFVAWVSSFLTVFDFTDMLEAGRRLVTPIVSTITSGFYFFKGYIQEMNLYNHPYLVTLGSGILLAGLFYILQKYGFFTGVFGWICSHLPASPIQYENVSENMANIEEVLSCCDIPPPMTRGGRRRWKAT